MLGKGKSRSNFRPVGVHGKSRSFNGRPNNGMQLTWLIGTQIRLGRLAEEPLGDRAYSPRHAADAHR